MLIVLIAKKDSDSDSGFSLTILEYCRMVNYSELPIPRPSKGLNFAASTKTGQVKTGRK